MDDVLCVYHGGNPLSLSIIGVVAAITLPSLTGNINERTWNTQRKALFARISLAVPLMGSVNGYANAEPLLHLIEDGTQTVTDALYWTTSVISSTKAWYFWLESGYANSDRLRTEAMSVRCVKR